MLDKILGVVVELEAAAAAWFCAGCGKRVDGPHVCPECAARLPEVSEEADAYCYGCGALFAGDGYAHQPGCRVAEESGEPQRAYMCAVCHRNPVEAEAGYDTCADCLARV